MSEGDEVGSRCWYCKKWTRYWVRGDARVEKRPARESMLSATQG